MPDANALRQRRHDLCMATTRCPRCAAWPGRECHALYRHINRRVYPRGVWKRAIQNAGKPANTAGVTGKIEGKIGRSDWGRQLGGLHAERWTAWEARSVVERLGEIIDA